MGNVYIYISCEKIIYPSQSVNFLVNFLVLYGPKVTSKSTLKIKLADLPYRQGFYFIYFLIYNNNTKVK